VRVSWTSCNISAQLLYVGRVFETNVTTSPLSSARRAPHLRRPTPIALATNHTVLFSHPTVASASVVPATAQTSTPAASTSDGKALTRVLAYAPDAELTDSEAAAVAVDVIALDSAERDRALTLILALEGDSSR